MSNRSDRSNQEIRQVQQDHHRPQLMHVFAAGLRFETEVRHQVRYPVKTPVPSRLQEGGGSKASGHRYSDRLLPLQLPTTLQGAGDDGEGDGERLGLVQCAAVLQQVLPDWGESPVLRKEALVSASPRDIGAAALEALQAGRMALVQFETPKACRWALVAGVEVALKQRRIKEAGRGLKPSKDTGPMPVRALLLLDARASAPWGCAYNARIEFQGVAGRSVRGQRSFRQTLRFSTGEAWAVRLCQLVVLERP